MEKFFQNIQEFHMLAPGDAVIIGVSGGADSVCLLFLLKQYADSHPELGIRLQALHVEHGIRGQESLADAAFVEDLCQKWEIPFQCVSYNVPKIAEEEHLTLEEAGRKVRYEAFAEAAGPAGKIAVAHNAGDQAETILWNLTRGSGLAGLCGMRPVRDQIIRPLLNVTREEIETCLRENDIPWRTDSTNQTLLYTRNRLRHQAIPALQEVNPRAVEHIGSLGERMERIYAYLMREANAWLGANGSLHGQEISFSVRAFREADPVLQDFILQEALREQGAGRKNIQASHLESLKALAKSQSGKRLSNLPGNLEALIQGDRYLLRNKKEPPKQQEAVTLPIPGEAFFGKYRVLAELEPVKNERIPEKKYTKWFDYDTIKDTIQLRSRSPGDYLTITPDGSRKKLKQYFIDEKIPSEERNQRLLLACGSHILWVVGGRISEAFKVTDKTKKILKVQIREETEHGRENSGIA
ncbi:MAG: tRNA lysidine(34) synthetase TilS [Eubacteriales bacterium]|nr:tRNA lysidine(34) synthetase TilS [Eubacteriales bacterium]